MSAPRGRQQTTARDGRPSRQPSRSPDDSAGPPAQIAPALIATRRIELQTFGYKFGDPPTADLTFDVRFLANPFWVPELQRLSGLEPEVREYVLRQPEAGRFLELVYNLVTVTFPAYLAEGRPNLTVALGCTGGFHRSIALGEVLAERLRRDGFNVTVHHRELHQ